jgi:hypothetical protein
MPTRKPKPKATEPDIQLLITSKCASISGRGEIRYSIGVNENKEVFVKLVSSSGGGQINNAWFPFADVLKQLEKYSEGGSFTSTTIFSPIFTNVSSNMAGFTLAVALKEKLVLPQAGNRRKFVHNSPAAFLARVDKLIAAKASKKSPRRKTKAATQSRVSA